MKLFNIALLVAAAAAAGAVAFLPMPGKAQTANSNAGANSGSVAGSTAGSTSGSAVVLDQSARNSGNVYNPAPPANLTIQNVPNVAPPSIVSGGPCVGAGASLGGAVMGFGVGGGVVTVDPDCTRRQNATTLANLGQKMAAFELLCADKDSYLAAQRAAARDATNPACTVNPAFEPPGTKPAPVPPVATVPPVQPVPIQRTAKVYPPCSRTLTDNCTAVR